NHAKSTFHRYGCRRHSDTYWLSERNFLPRSAVSTRSRSLQRNWAAVASVAHRRAGAAIAEARKPRVSRVDQESSGATLHEPGTESFIRVQSRGSGTRLSRGGTSRSQSRDSLLG